MGNASVINAEQVDYYICRDAREGVISVRHRYAHFFEDKKKS